MSRRTATADEAAELRRRTRSERISACRLPGIILLAVIFLILITVPLLAFLLPMESVSVEENRLLAGMPRFSLRAVFDGSYTSDLEDCLSDQFPCRRAVIGVYSRIMLASQIFTEVNGVTLGYDGYLIALPSRTSASREGLNKSLEAVDRLCELLDKDKVTVAIAAPPAESLGASMPRIARWAAEPGFGLPSSAEAIYITDLPDGSFYRTDHHWTSYGAYSAYCKLADSLGVEAYGAGSFSVTEVADGFCGTLASRSGLYGRSSDTVTLYRYEGDGSFTVCDGQSGEKLLDGLYDFDALEIKDKYSVFLGGNYGDISITAEGEERERLLLIKDSYANSVIPFLARHFDIRAIDPRYFHGDIREIADSCDRVLILYSRSQLETDAFLPRLLIGVSAESDVQHSHNGKADDDTHSGKIGISVALPLSFGDELVHRHEDHSSGGEGERDRKQCADVYYGAGSDKSGDRLCHSRCLTDQKAFQPRASLTSKGQGNGSPLRKVLKPYTDGDGNGTG